MCLLAGHKRSLLASQFATDQVLWTTRDHVQADAGRIRNVKAQGSLTTSSIELLRGLDKWQGLAIEAAERIRHAGSTKKGAKGSYTVYSLAEAG